MSPSSIYRTLQSLGFAIVVFAHGLVFGHEGVSLTSRLTTALPVIDGVISPGEWSSAGTLPFTIQGVSGTLYVMHDSTFLYVAARLADPTSGLNSFQLIFDNNHDGMAQRGDNALVVNLGAHFAFDDFFDGRCCFVFDREDGGADELVAFGTYAHGEATFELQYPLYSADTLHDFCLSPGSIIGFNVVYQPGNGAFYSGFPSLSPFNTGLFGDLIISQSSIAVAIDIKPDSTSNAINPRSQGRVPVAILSSRVFDAPSQVDHTSLTFGSTGTEASLAFCNSTPQDVNGDGLLDLVCHFDTQKARFREGDRRGVLTGRTTSGVLITGEDAIRIVPTRTP